MSRLRGILTDPLLSVVMPVYNEAATIEEMIRRVLAVPLRTQLIVVDDCSTDGTRDMLAGLQRELGFTLLLQPENRGKGAALRTGFGSVRGDLVVIQDADLEYSPEEFPDLIELICQGRADVVYGSRFLDRPMTMNVNGIANRVLTLLTNMLYGARITDMETAYKMVRKPVFDRLRLECRRFDFEPEITAKLLRCGYSIRELPIAYTPRTREQGKKIKWQDGIVAVRVLFRYRVAPFERIVRGVENVPAKAS